MTWLDLACSAMMRFSLGHLRQQLYKVRTITMMGFLGWNKPHLADGSAGGSWQPNPGIEVDRSLRQSVQPLREAHQATRLQIVPYLN